MHTLNSWNSLFASPKMETHISEDMNFLYNSNDANILKFIVFSMVSYYSPRWPAFVRKQCFRCSLSHVSYFKRSVEIEILLVLYLKEFLKLKRSSASTRDGWTEWKFRKKKTTIKFITLPTVAYCLCLFSLFIYQQQKCITILWILELSSYQLGNRHLDALTVRQKDSRALAIGFHICLYILSTYLTSFFYNTSNTSQVLIIVKLEHRVKYP